MSEYKEYFIIMTGSTALNEAVRILQDNGGFKDRYSKRYLCEALMNLKEKMKEEERTGEFLLDPGTGFMEKSGCFILPCGSGGVFGALYRLGEELGLGIRVRLDEIPIEQTAVELCDCLNINPYEADSSGAYLIAAESAGMVLEEMKKQGIRAKIIGYTVKDKARIVIGPTERYLTKP